MSARCAPANADEAERGFNNRAAVPDYAAWFERWLAESLRTVDALKPALDLRYGPNPKETLDLFVPSQPARGTLMFIHGGYWRSLDKRDHSFVAAPFVAEGLAVAVVNYDLCPAVTIATIVDECRRAVAWLVRDGPRHGANPSRLVVSGHSAGGHLAAMLLATPAAALGAAVHPLSGAISISGVHDLRPLTMASMNADLQLTDTEAARLSPVLLTPATHAPLAIAAGADETPEFVRQSEIMAQAWPDQRPRGVESPMLVPGRHHFSVLSDYGDRASALTRLTLALF